MKTVIISSGEIYDYSFCRELVKAADRIICADGGIRHAVNMKLTPDVIMGDMDSAAAQYIEHFEKKGVEVIRYPKDKDKTDTQICLEFALTFSTEVVMLGASGSRLDHTIANISLLKLGFEKNIPISILDNKNQIWMINSSISIEGNIGDLFSLIPFTERVEGVTTKGAHYELENAVMEHGNPYGVSNYFEKKIVEVSIKRGCLLVIKSKD